MLYQDLNNLWKKGTSFLGVEKAILCGAMSWISERNLVSAISNAGAFGIIASGAMSADLLRQEIKATHALTEKPFGVNIVTMHPELEELIDVCIENNIKHIFLSGGIPKKHHISRIHQGQAKAICFGTTLSLARRLVDKMFIDALILEGSEAGGHIGSVSTGVLAQEILPYISSVPIFVAGGIARGESIANYLLMGASGCQLGTRFVCSKESIAHDRYKQRFIEANSRDAVVSYSVSDNFPVIPVRGLKNQAYYDFIDYQKKVIQDFENEKLTHTEAKLKIEYFWAGALKRAVIEGDIDSGSVMAGQSVGMVTKIQSVEHIIEELVQQILKVNLPSSNYETSTL